MFGLQNGRKGRRKLDKNHLPAHVAIIMDGNGRWAKKRGLPRSAGHSMGAKNLEKIVEYAGNLGIKYLTVYAFSTENWKRPKDEVDALMRLLTRYLKDYDTLLGAKDARVCVLGARDGLSDEIIALIDEVERKSRHKTGITINIALNYGGRQEILEAVRGIAKDVKAGRLSEDAITEEAIAERLYTAGMPDPDLIIRPSGEYRLSNFLLWQCAYSEFWFSSIFWPDFSPKRFETALIDYQMRSRRYGGV